MATVAGFGKLTLSDSSRGVMAGRTFPQFTETPTGDNYYHERKSIPAADTALTFGSVAAADQGYCFLFNWDATNYVDFGRDVAGAISPNVRVPPLCAAGPFKLIPSASYRAQANTLPVDLEILVLQK